MNLFDLIYPEAVPADHVKIEIREFTPNIPGMRRALLSEKGWPEGLQPSPDLEAEIQKEIEDLIDRYLKKLEKIKAPRRRKSKPRKSHAKRLAWDYPYIPPKSADRRVRIFYISQGGELLSCDSGLLSRSAAETLIRRLAGHDSDAVMLQGIYHPTDETIETYFYREPHGRYMRYGYNDTPYNESLRGRNPVPNEVLAKVAKARHVILPSQREVI